MCDAFQEPQETIRWAEEALAELKNDFSKFRNRKPAKMSLDFDRGTGENIISLELILPVPRSLRRKATEALIHARHSFDQSTFAAQSALGYEPKGSVNYPWASNPTDLRRLMENRKIDPRIWPTVEDHHPYKTSSNYDGGNDLIRVLATIANKKHSVGLTVAGRTGAHTVPVGILMNSESFKVSAGSWDLANGKVEIVRWKGAKELGHKYGVESEICIQDARLPRAINALDALSQFVTHASHVCDTLRAECTRHTD